MKDPMLLVILGYFFILIASAVTAAVIGFHTVKFTEKVYKQACRVHSGCTLIFVLLIAAIFYVGLFIERGDKNTQAGYILVFSTIAFMPVPLASTAFLRGLDEQRKANRVPGAVLAQQFREAYRAQLRAETQAKAAAEVKANADSRAEAQTEVDAHPVT